DRRGLSSALRPFIVSQGGRIACACLRDHSESKDEGDENTDNDPGHRRYSLGKRYCWMIASSGARTARRRAARGTGRVGTGELQCLYTSTPPGNYGAAERLPPVGSFYLVTNR